MDSKRSLRVDVDNIHLRHADMDCINDIYALVEGYLEEKDARYDRLSVSIEPQSAMESGIKFPDFPDFPEWPTKPEWNVEAPEFETVHENWIPMKRNHFILYVALPFIAAALMIGGVVVGTLL